MNRSQSPGAKCHPCPICGSPVSTNPRYPTAVCPACVERAVDERGRPLRFYNRSLSGGFQAVYADSDEEHVCHECWIDGVRCWAGEAHLCGIVVYSLYEGQFACRVWLYVPCAERITAARGLPGKPCPA